MFEMGSKLQGDIFETKKEDKNRKKKVSNFPKDEHRLVFQFEKRRGKPVTLIGRFYIDEELKKETLKLLKKKLASGGSVKDEWIEIQGDVKQKAKDILLENGWKFKNN